ncbi:MAG: signal recognition particle-docking protein FtsY [Bacteroidota bacterium]
MGFFDFFKRSSKKKKKKEAAASATPVVSTTSTPVATPKLTTSPAAHPKPRPASPIKKPKVSFFGQLKRLFVGKPRLDNNLLEEIEELLVSTDMGMDTVDQLLKELKTYAGQSLDIGQAVAILKAYIIKLLQAINTPPQSSANDATPTADTPVAQKPHIILIVGVNGVGKTTTIGKLASQFSKEGKKVMIGAADTFRAAAITQLEVWGKRVGVPVISQGMHKDPGAVAYDAVTSAIAQDMDILIVDTAGRLHNKVGLMNELTKVKRVIGKKMPNAPQEILLVVDGSTGQNAWQQARIFHEALHVTGLIVTKLDGVAKGGVVIGITETLGIPIRYIGLGEQLEDLQPFEPEAFTEILFKDTAQEG